MSRNKTLPTPQEFRTAFPDFSDTTRYPDSIIQLRLNIFDQTYSEQQYKGLFPYAAELYVAHFLVLYDRSQKSIAIGGNGGEVSGNVASKSADNLSVSYDNSFILRQGIGEWGLTLWGIMFYDEILRPFSIGVTQL